MRKLLLLAALLLGATVTNAYNITWIDLDPAEIQAARDAIPGIFATAAAVSPTVLPSIAYGNNAAPGQFPSVVSLQYNLGSGYRHLCGGTLIYPTMVLTAAHCITDENGNDKPPGLVYIGATIVEGVINGSTNAQEIFPVTGYTVNPDFIYQPVTNDVAIIKFGGVSKFPTANMATVLPPVGTQLTSVGWGADQQTSATGVYPKNLQYASVTLSTNTGPCPDLGDDGEYCSAYSNNGSGGYPGSCAGDSGGPELLANTNTIVGITSWGPDGYDCGQAPWGASTSVPYFYDSFIVPTMVQYGDPSIAPIPSPVPSPPPPPTDYSPPGPSDYAPPPAADYAPPPPPARRASPPPPKPRSPPPRHSPPVRKPPPRRKSPPPKKRPPPKKPSKRPPPKKSTKKPPPKKHSG